ncbi:MAG: succinate-semialdehyde dehydrogenase (NADP(+)), partial [Hoeflea sp.]|nr:succinate-semialdehyde dehydrogenase (NADP(+)) [Hoeflea sp.]
MTLTLSDPSLLETRGLLGGEWVEGSKTFAVVNPATGETIADVADLTAEDTRKAIDIAYEAQKE